MDHGQSGPHGPSVVFSVGMDLAAVGDSVTHRRQVVPGSSVRGLHMRLETVTHTRVRGSGRVGVNMVSARRSAVNHRDDNGGADTA